MIDLWEGRNRLHPPPPLLPHLHVPGPGASRVRGVVHGEGPAVGHVGATRVGHECVERGGVPVVVGGG